MRRPPTPDTFENQRFRLAVRNRDQVDVTLVFNLDALMEVLHEQRPRLAGNIGHRRNKFSGRTHEKLACEFPRHAGPRVGKRDRGFSSRPLREKLSYFRLPPSSAMYIISCLKMNRFGSPSLVSRTMFLS